MNYSVKIKRSVGKELSKIEKPERGRLIDAIDRLAENPLQGAVLKGELRGLRRIRVGDYRVLYEVRDQELVVLVVRGRHRREVYREKVSGLNLSGRFALADWLPGEDANR